MSVGSVIHVKPKQLDLAQGCGGISFDMLSSTSNLVNNVVVAFLYADSSSVSLEQVCRPETCLSNGQPVYFDPSASIANKYKLFTHKIHRGYKLN